MDWFQKRHLAGLVRVIFLLRNVIIISILTALPLVEVVSQSLDSFKSELEQIYDTNLKLRSKANKLITSGDFDSPMMDSLKTEILWFDSLSLIQVTEIINTNGWLGISEIGELGNQAIFMTMQHADLENQVRYYPLLMESAEKGESHLADMATMEDRILVRQGKKQRYGTQSKYVDGKKTLLPIEDEKNVNKRRKSVGLKRLKNTKTKNS